MATVFAHSGKAWVVTKLNDSSATSMNRVAWGTGAGTAASADTTLFTEAGETRATGAITQQTTTITGDTYQVIGTLTSTSNKTITNAGLFDAASAGNLLIKGDFTGIPLLTNDSIEFTFKLQVVEGP